MFPDITEAPAASHILMQHLTFSESAYLNLYMCLLVHENTEMQSSWCDGLTTHLRFPCNMHLLIYQLSLSSQVMHV